MRDFEDHFIERKPAGFEGPLHEQYISSLYSYNFAKISLARALGVAEEGVKEYFKGK
jgi:hypothetical protein